MPDEKSRISGRATPQFTREHSRKSLDSRALGGSGLWVSRYGFGSYRIDLGSAEHEAALRRALEGGVNLIDTSANYGDGGSEQLIGRVLRETIAAGRLRREAVVVVTKGGYVQGANMAEARRREAAERPWEDMVKVSPDCWHCLHPAFLRDQIERSRARLGLETLDVYLLHNPEYFLAWAEREGWAIDAARVEYERRLETAFAALDTAAGEGLIGGWGVSSNTFGEPANTFTHTSLARCLALAEAAAARATFLAVQMPGNVLEPGGWTEANQPGGLTAVALAAREGLGVLLNRPLNAIDHGRLLRLADPPTDASAMRWQAEESLTKLLELERQAGFDGNGPGAAGARPDAQGRPGGGEGGKSEDFEHVTGNRAVQTVGMLLRDRWSHIPDRHTWELFVAGDVVPRVREELHALTVQPRHLESPQSWRVQYLDTLHATLTAMGDYIEATRRRRNDALHAALDEALGEHGDPEAPLQIKALRMLLTVEGVGCVLVGMKRVRYVEEILGA